MCEIKGSSLNTVFKNYCKEFVLFLRIYILHSLFLTKLQTATIYFSLQKQLNNKSALTNILPQNQFLTSCHISDEIRWYELIAVPQGEFLFRLSDGFMKQKGNTVQYAEKIQKKPTTSHFCIRSLSVAFFPVLADRLRNHLSLRIKELQAYHDFFSCDVLWFVIVFDLVWFHAIICASGRY